MLPLAGRIIGTTLVVRFRWYQVRAASFMSLFRSCPTIRGWSRDMDIRVEKTNLRISSTLWHLAISPSIAYLCLTKGPWIVPKRVALFNKEHMFAVYPRWVHLIHLQCGVQPLISTVASPQCPQTMLLCINDIWWLILIYVFVTLTRFVFV